MPSGAKLGNSISLINDILGKTKDDPGWEDVSYLKMGAKNGDFNADGQVNIDDFMVFREAFNNNYNPKVDLNFDGKIDISDFEIFREYFGQTLSSPAWNDQNVTIANTGYKHLDINKDGKISPEDKGEYITSLIGDEILIREKGKEEVYLLRNGKRYSPLDSETKDVLGFGFREIKEISKEDFSLIDDGGSIKLYRDGSLIKDGDNYYLILDGKKSKFPSPASLIRHGFNEQNAIPANIDHIQQGEDMPEYPDGMILKDKEGRYYITEKQKARLIEGGLEEIGRRGLGERKESTITIEVCRGVGEFVMGLMVDGEMVKEWNVKEQGEYSLQLPLSVGLHEIKLMPTHLKKPEGIWIAVVTKVPYLKVNNETFPIDWYPDSKEPKTISVVVEPANIEEKPESMPVIAPFYENGTLVKKEEGGQLYVLFNNERYAISSLSRKLYGLENKEIKIIGEAIEEIPLGEEELPLYPDKTMIKGPDGKQQVILDGKRWTIPDEETFEAMGLSKTKEREVVIKARAGTELSNPMLQLKIDNRVIKEWVISSTKSKEYKVKVPLSDGKISLDVMALNAQVSNFLVIEEIKIDGKTHLPSEEAIYDYAGGNDYPYYFNPQVYTDGKYLAGGSNSMPFPGAQRFNIELDSAISLTDAEIAEIPDGGTLTKSFKDGRLVKSEDKTYLISQGERIPLSEGYLKLGPSRMED